MFLETNSAKSKFLSRYFQKAVQGKRLPNDGPLQMKMLTIEDLAALSRDIVSGDYPRVNRSVLEEILDDFHLETYDPATAADSTKAKTDGYSCEDVRCDFIDYVKSIRPQPTVLNTPAKTNPRTHSYSNPSASRINRSEFRKTQSLQSVLSNISASTSSSSATDSDYSVPTTDDEGFSPAHGHSRVDSMYALPLEKGKLPETHGRIVHQLSAAVTQQGAF
ncbi:hypothetical protein K493DRAFT_313903 [Basidiobolus meristosporus CBS 931.73]|uniref:Uncharacterized protein n=1 Tax=Basidiobolus meristosporus CBS 931.73 TaxID=1314790 RepID=A0A1Y1YJX6_9FUNG|nr:hypothetical protein K493DRAFT_313903 [Basidiobolus meristosporus CBS 931.73]|eukprot:ORX97894.1 hypothetical protein K493DRAFT_313903 [Basidiobolus meristosporus CBS 931.73]